MDAGHGRGRSVAMGPRGTGGKYSYHDMMNSVGTEVGNDHSLLSTTDDGGMDEELRNELKQQVMELTSKVEEIERQVTEVNRIRASLRRNKSLSLQSTMSMKEGNKEKVAGGNKKQPEAQRSKRMTELIRQLGTILKQISQHRWAWPFMEPVDVKALGLNDYFDIIKKPMDLGTIRDRMDLKDGTGYNHIQEICNDIRLVFSNALCYNAEGSDVYIMAKALAEKFEDKWKTVLEPKLQEEESKRRQEEKEATAKEVAALHAAEEAATEKLADDVSRQLEDLDKELEDLKQKATPHCRTMSIEEKRQLGHSLGRLPTENLQRVIQIIAQKNPGFNPSADEVEVDIDAQEPATLWRLHRFVQSVTNLKSKTPAQGSPVSSKRESFLSPDEGVTKRPRKLASP